MPNERIHKTNVDLIRKQVYDLIKDLEGNHSSSIQSDPSLLEEKYNYLFNTSKTLFKYIVTQYGTSRFNQDVLDKNLDMMLKSITKIQSSKLTQEDASIQIGESLAKQYIPQMQDK